MAGRLSIKANNEDAFGMTRIEAERGILGILLNDCSKSKDVAKLGIVSDNFTRWSTSDEGPSSLHEVIFGVVDGFGSKKQQPTFRQISEIVDALSGGVIPYPPAAPYLRPVNCFGPR